MEDELITYQKIEIGDYVRRDGVACTVIDREETETGVFCRTSDDCAWHAEESLRPIVLLNNAAVVAEVFETLIGKAGPHGSLNAEDLLDIARCQYGMTIFCIFDEKSIDNPDEV